MIIRDMKVLHPKFRRLAEGLNQSLARGYEAGETQTRFEVFETFRDPVRQLELLAKGTTKAGPWQSGHAFGLACDFVPVIDNAEAIALGNQIGERVLPGWSWHSSHDWDYLTKKAKAFGLGTISWDRPHVQHPRLNELLLFMKNL